MARSPAPQERAQHWDKVIRLVEMAKADPKVAETLKKGSPSAKLEVLQKVGLELKDLKDFYDDIETLGVKTASPIWTI
jgi:hypothetical protein